MALDKKTGRLAWGSEPPPVDDLLDRITDDNGATYMTPVVYEYAGNRFAMIYGWKGLCSVDVKTGKTNWVYPWSNYNNARTPDPVIFDGQVFLADDCLEGNELGKRFSTLLSLSAEGPSVVWKSYNFYSDIASPIVFGEYIYGVYGGKYRTSVLSSVRCINSKNGELVWEHHPLVKRSSKWISLSAAKDKLFVLYESGRIEIIEATPKGYQVISGCELPKKSDEAVRYATAPVLSKGRLYCRNFSGTLLCIDLRN
jgi:outer membrane protein assembly factor BamB